MSKKTSLAARAVAAAATALLTVGLAACGGSSGSTAAGGGASSEALTLGFAQVGAESGWRTANTKSIQDSAAAAGVNLKFSDGQQKQENQIKAIRSYIQQKVDVIAFSPVVTTGLGHGAAGGQAGQHPGDPHRPRGRHPRHDAVQDVPGLGLRRRGQEGGRLARRARRRAPPVRWRSSQLEGTTGSAPAIDRTKGFADAIAANPNLKVVASQTGDFTRSGGKQVMEAFLKSQPKIDVVYAQNDDMGLGAIEAIQAAGKVPGKDIKIITVDAVKDGMQALADGKINFIVECSPLLGPQLMDLAKKVKDGQTVPARVLTEETTFDQAAAQAALPERKY